MFPKQQMSTAEKRIPPKRAAPTPRFQKPVVKPNSLENVMAGQQVTFVTAETKQDRAPSKENAVSVDAGDNTPETEKEGQPGLKVTAEVKEDSAPAIKNVVSVDAGDSTPETGKEG
jgi:hypothetical protein